VVGITVDGIGAVIAAGVKGYVVVPFACTIVAATLLSIDASATAGSIAFDVLKSNLAGYPPSSSIVASAPPTLSSQNHSRDTTLTGWTTSISAGDVIGFSVKSLPTPASVTRVVLILEVTR
jgi:hypothetical protein